MPIINNLVMLYLLVNNSCSGVAQCIYALNKVFPKKHSLHVFNETFVIFI